MVEDHDLRQAIGQGTFSLECDYTNVIITLFSWLSVWVEATWRKHL